MNPEYYYLSAYRLSDNQIIFLRIYRKYHDLIVSLLIEYDFKLCKYPETEFNKMYYNSTKKQRTDYSVLSFDEDSKTEQIEKQLKKAYESKTT